MRFLLMVIILPIIATFEVSPLFANILPSVPPSSFPDTEVSTNLTLRAWEADLRNFNVSLIFDSTPSNNVQIAFGTDADGDSFLSDGETRLIAGWDCGMNVLTLPLQYIQMREVASSGFRKMLSFQMRLTSTGTPESFFVKDGEDFIFTNLTSSATFSSLSLQEWDFMRLTARGVDVHNAAFDLEYMPDALIFFLR